MHLQNAVSRRYYGDTLGKTTEDVCPDERILARWLEKNRRAFAGERVEGDVELAIRGEQRYFHNIITPIRDGGEAFGILGVNIDITEQKRAEVALRQSERCYRALAESTRDIIYIVDRQGTLLYANQAASQRTGISAGEIVGKRQADLFPSEMAQAHVEKIGRVIATGEVLEEDELFHFGPEEVWLRVHLLPLRDEAGQITSVMGVCHNITERKRAEEMLRESEERYRHLAEAIPHPVWRSDAEGKQIDCNRRWQEYTGQTPEEAQGDGWMKALHPDDVAWAVQRKREDVAGGKIYQAEYRLWRASDRSYRWHLAQAVPMKNKDGKILAWFGSVVDIDDQKQAQEALVEREARLLEAQEVARLGFYVMDIAKGRWTSSEVLDRIFGIPVDYERTVDGWDDLVHPDERQEMLDYFLKEVVGEKKPFDREYQIVRYGDKQVRWVHGLGRLEFGKEGQPVSMLGTIQDITERKQTQVALKKAHDELKQRVQERTAELSKANECLRQSNDELQTIYDGMIEGLLITDIETKRFLRVNPSMCRMLGYSEKELLAASIKDIHPPEEVPNDLQKFQAAAEGRVSINEDRPIVRKDGQCLLCGYHGSSGFL